MTAEVTREAAAIERSPLVMRSRAGPSRRSSRWVTHRRAPAAWLRHPRRMPWYRPCQGRLKSLLSRRGAQPRRHADGGGQLEGGGPPRTLAPNVTASSPVSPSPAVRKNFFPPPPPPFHAGRAFRLRPASPFAFDAGCRAPLEVRSRLLPPRRTRPCRGRRPRPCRPEPRGRSAFISPDGTRFALLADPGPKDPLAEVRHVVENAADFALRGRRAWREWSLVVPGAR